tara:strand:+ start:151 stop:894 length:744 start_codon:yes stop_codon:yes gene_type:complete
MAKNAVLKPEELDINIIKYSDVKKMQSGSKIAYINYGEGIDSILIESPECMFPFDNTYYPESEGNGKYSCKISLKADDSPEMVKFVEAMSKLDEKIKEDAKKNSQAWLGKKSISDEVIEEKYKPIVKPYKDPNTGELTGKYPAQMGFKIHQKNDQFQCKFYDEKRNRINVDNKDEPDFIDHSKLMAKGNTVKILLKCHMMWFSTAGFGCTWKAEQIKVKVPEKLEDYAFRDDDEFVDEEEEEEVKEE